MSGNAVSAVRTLFQLSDGNLWQVPHSNWCAFSLCGKSVYFSFFGVGFGSGSGFAFTGSDGRYKVLNAKKPAIQMPIKMRMSVFTLVVFIAPQMRRAQFIR